MKVRELIFKLYDYNKDAEVGVIAHHKVYPFTLSCRTYDGGTKKDADEVYFYVGDLCQEMSEGRRGVMFCEPCGKNLAYKKAAVCIECFQAALAREEQLRKAKEAVVGYLDEDGKKLDAALQREKRLRDVLNEIYPVIAGMVISSQKRFEKEAEEHWNQYCHMILNALEGDGSDGRKQPCLDVFSGR